MSFFNLDYIYNFYKKKILIKFKYIWKLIYYHNKNNIKKFFSNILFKTSDL